MEAREYLEQVRKIDKLIENKRIEQEQWRYISYGTTISASNGDRVQSSGSKQKMADAVCKIVDIDNEISDMIKRYIDIKQDVIKTIEKLDFQSYDFAHKRYIQGKDLLDICELYGRTMSSVKRRQGKALKQVQIILDERVKNEKR